MRPKKKNARLKQRDFDSTAKTWLSKMLRRRLKENMRKFLLMNLNANPAKRSLKRKASWRIICKAKSIRKL